MSDSDTQAYQSVKDYLQRADYGRLKALLEPLHSADIADILGDLANEEKVIVLKQLANEKAAEVLAVVDDHSGQALLELLTDSEVVSLLEEMPSDDAADIISTLPPEKSKQVDALLPSLEREKLYELLEFEEDTAGGIMEVEKVAVREQATIRDAIELVRKLADQIENVEDVYVVDHSGKLIGHIPVLDLILHEPEEKVTDVMVDTVTTVPVDMDQEEVANLFGKYDEFTLPVIDDEGKLVGRITVDDIIDVIEEEASEDIARIAGTVEGEIGETSPIKISRARLPWLIFALLGQMVNALIMSQYATSIETALALVFFVPLVIGTAGGTGIQAAVVVVREIAVGEVSTAHIGKRILRELQVTFVNGLILGAILFGVVMLWRTEIALGLLLWSTLLTVTIVAAFMGASIPLLMNRTRVDPAIATGPFITVMSDIVGLLIYMAFATYYVSRLHTQ
ncbi:MAG: magnesium transporter [Candidatus Krumholzibacteria bacterium]|nr:magnesium transporter [Candidatus Krumholzibacteria bacterium]